MEVMIQEKFVITKIKVKADSRVDTEVLAKLWLSLRLKLTLQLRSKLLLNLMFRLG